MHKVHDAILFMEITLTNKHNIPLYGNINTQKNTQFAELIERQKRFFFKKKERKKEICFHITHMTCILQHIQNVSRTICIYIYTSELHLKHSSTNNNP